MKQFGGVLFSDPADHWYSVGVKTVSEEVHFEDGHDEIREALHINRPMTMHYTYNGSGHFSIKIFYDEDTEVDYGAQEEVTHDVEGELAWFKDLTRPMSTGDQVLPIPASAVIEHLEHKPPSLNIILPDGNLVEWTIKWADDRPNSCVFGLGWYKFAKEKQLCARNQLLFFKMEQEDTYRVEVRRHNVRT